MRQLSKEIIRRRARGTALRGIKFDHNTIFSLCQSRRTKAKPQPAGSADDLSHHWLSIPRNLSHAYFNRLPPRQSRFCEP
jgi:hypothetical protein